ncbi:MAG: DUF4384 domain-containing protein [Chitinivibrionales bacterium]|nr:DUF4384 domain-containing protein [Chitinivibrionales bacterium]
MKNILQQACDEISIALFINGKLEPEKKETFERHIADCETCRTKMEELRKAKETFGALHPFEDLVKDPRYHERIKTSLVDMAERARLPSHPASHRKSKTPAGRTMLFTPSFLRNRFFYAIAAMVIIGIGISPYVFTSVKKNDQMTCKGQIPVEPLLFLFVKQPDGSAQQRPEHQYQAGETIQFAYASPSLAYVILMSINEQGRTAILFPQKSDSSAAISVQGTNALPAAFKLDSYPGKELYCAFFSKNKLSISDQEKRIIDLFHKNKSLKDIAFTKAPDLIVSTILTSKLP